MGYATFTLTKVDWWEDKRQNERLLLEAGTFFIHVPLPPKDFVLRWPEKGDILTVASINNIWHSIRNGKKLFSCVQNMMTSETIGYVNTLMLQQGGA